MVLLLSELKIMAHQLFEAISASPVFCWMIV